MNTHGLPGTLAPMYYEGMVYGFVAFLGSVDTADRALSEMGAWAKAIARRAAAVSVAT
jgi:hypothetical protein